MSTSEIGALIIAKPEEAKQRILAALVEAQGDRKRASELLDTTHRSFYRFIERLRLWDEIDKLVEERGFPRIPGPPRSTKKIRDAILAADGSLVRASRALDTRVDALRSRITELGMWDDLDRVLDAAHLPRLERPKPAA